MQMHVGYLEFDDVLMIFVNSNMFFRDTMWVNPENFSLFSHVFHSILD